MYRNLAKSIAIVLSAGTFAVLVQASQTPGLAMAGGDNSQPMAASGSFDAGYSEAVALINKNDLDGAIMKLKMLDQASPKNADVLNYLGYAHRQKGLFEEARSYYDQALAVDPNHKGAHEYLGELFLQVKDLAAAEAQLKKLDSLCSFGCAEYRELKKKIDAYRAS